MATRYRKDISSEEIRVVKIFKHIYLKRLRGTPQEVEKDKFINIPKINIHNDIPTGAMFPEWENKKNEWRLVSFRPAGKLILLRKHDFRNICKTMTPRVTESHVIACLFKMGLLAVFGTVSDYWFRYVLTGYGEFFMLESERMDANSAITGPKRK